MPLSRTSPKRRTLPALLVPFVALALQYALWPWIQPWAWFSFYPAIFVSAWLGGLRAGLGATLISVLMVWWFFIPPEYSFEKSDPRYLVPVVLFVLMGVIFNLLSESLRHSEERYRELFDQAGDGFFLADLHGRYTDVNAAGCRMLGYSHDEIVGKYVTDLIAVEDTQRLDQIRQQLLQGGVHVSEWTLRRKDGARLLTEINAKILPGGVWQASVRDITERKKIESELLESRNKLREMVAHHEMASEEERRHLAREVHDELGQLITALRMDLTLLRPHAALNPDIGSLAADMRSLVDKMSAVARGVVTSLRPAALDAGLVPALEWLAQDFGQRWSIRCRVDAPDDDLPLREGLAAVIFRIVQESLTNVARHAQATEVSIALKQAGLRLHVRVQDNGRGFDSEAANHGPGFGLLSMRERVLSLGGSARVYSHPGGGTAVVIEVPI